MTMVALLLYILILLELKCPVYTNSILKQLLTPYFSIAFCRSSNLIVKFQSIYLYSILKSILLDGTFSLPTYFDCRDTGISSACFVGTRGTCIRHIISVNEVVEYYGSMLVPRRVILIWRQCNVYSCNPPNITYINFTVYCCKCSD
jgi:hypothetical protein